jgi:hypothetical protein
MPTLGETTKPSLSWETGVIIAGGPILARSLIGVTQESLLPNGDYSA